MSYARQLLDTYPGTLTTDAGALAATLEALSDCAQACAADADADLAEQNLAEMVKCIRLCLDCTDVCTATLGVVSRQYWQAGAGEQLHGRCRPSAAARFLAGVRHPGLDGRRGRRRDHRRAARRLHRPSRLRPGLGDRAVARHPCLLPAPSPLTCRNAAHWCAVDGSVERPCAARVAGRRTPAPSPL